MVPRPMPDEVEELIDRLEQRATEGDLRRWPWTDDVLALVTEARKLRDQAAAVPEIVDLLTRGKDALRARVTGLTEELANSEHENKQLKAAVDRLVEERQF